MILALMLLSSYYRYQPLTCFIDETTTVDALTVSVLLHPKHLGDLKQGVCL